MSDEFHTAAAAALERIQHRYTPVRRGIVQALAEAGGPLSMPDILSARNGLVQSSVYRNLTILEQAGVVRRVAGATDFVLYELSEDLTSHHHHLVCLGCGSVTDFDMPRGLERSLQRAIDEAVARTGFRTESHLIDLRGRCATCA